jgi:hypothetical protein
MKSKGNRFQICLPGALRLPGEVPAQLAFTTHHRAIITN